MEVKILLCCYCSCQPGCIPGYLVQAHCCMLCRRKLKLVPVAKDRQKTRIEVFFLVKEKGWPLSWLEVPAAYICLSEVCTWTTGICWKREMDGVVKSSWHSCCLSSDLPVEGQAGCCICGRISGVVAVNGNIAETHDPAHENWESIG